LTPPVASVILENTQVEGFAMFILRRWFAVATLLVAFLLIWPEVRGQEIKSGPQPDEALPGSFQPLNLNGEYKDRQHCLVCQFRTHPVALIFVRQTGVKVDPELEKLLMALENTVKEHFATVGFSSFVVFITPDARSSAVDGIDDKDADPIKEAVKREKLIVSLRDKAKDYNKVIWTICQPDNIKNPDDSIKIKYKLSDKADVTILLYIRHRVVANYAFEGQLTEDAVAKVLKGVDNLLERAKKGDAAKK
jgi:hypothetical protein